MARNLKVGDHAKLTTSGPVMAITRHNLPFPHELSAEETFDCSWFVRGELRQAVFPASALVRVSKARKIDLQPPCAPTKTKKDAK